MAMTSAPQSLAGAPWLSARAVRAIFAAIGRDGDEIRIVGGAVRNAFLGVPVVEVDFATTATPDVVAARAEAAGFKVVPTGVEHGTLTVVADGRGYEVTTLREDIETDGRRAIVRFGRDWVADARRRDFTFNALSVDRDGTVHDPLGGYDDVMAGRIRFIGEPDRRIAEDRLRILRFFRFHAQYGRGALDREGLSAAIRGRNGLRDLSAERIGQEMRRLAGADRAAETVSDMQDAGILPIVLGGIGYVAPIRRLQAFEKALGLTTSIPLRLAALGSRIEEDALRLAERFRLSNSERDRMVAATAAIDELLRRPDAKAARRALYRLGAEAFRDGVALAFAWSADAADDPYWRDLLTLPERWPAPSFPLGGRDVVGGTSVRGPQVGTLLKAIEAWWIDNDFAPDETALRARLQQMVAAAQ
jgi:tRNA nucleotidyltransferase/poly(A) polymerase